MFGKSNTNESAKTKNVSFEYPLKNLNWYSWSLIIATFGILSWLTYEVYRFNAQVSTFNLKLGYMQSQSIANTEKIELLHSQLNILVEDSKEAKRERNEMRGDLDKILNHLGIE